MSTVTTERMPVLFAGHGSPMNAIEDNRWSRGMQAMAGQLPKPRAILAISAHWMTEGTWLTGNQNPPTIHDFGGFPQALFDMEYPAPGSPGLAARTAALIPDFEPEIRHDWGLDHGTWSVLHWLFPDAEIPVVQLSLNARLAPARQIALGQALRPLRDEGILIMASGNIVHNLRDAYTRRQRGETTPPDWAERFDTQTAEAVECGDHDTLANLWPGRDGANAHPSPDHWFPLLYAAGAAMPEDRVSFPIAGFDWASLSMRSILWQAT